jgi:opacity protein-like surface antigen
VSGHLCNGVCGSTETADIEAWSGLVNGYIDLGTFYGITPYVGAGVGVSYLNTSNASTVGGAAYASGSETTTNLAWALMAGASYAVNDQVSIDAGYRYFNLGDAKTTQIDPTGAQVGHINYKGIDAHEIRLGIRYNLY